MSTLFPNSTSEFFYSQVSEKVAYSDEALVSNFNNLRKVRQGYGSILFVRDAVVAAMYYRGVDISEIVAWDGGSTSPSVMWDRPIYLEGKKIYRC